MFGGLLLRTYRSIERSAAAQTFWFGLVTRYADINNYYYVAAGVASHPYESE